MAKFLLHEDVAPFRILGTADIGGGNPGTVPPPEAGTVRVWDSGGGGDLTESEFQLAGSGERPRWIAGNAAGSRVTENPYPRLRFDPDTVDVDEGAAGVTVDIYAENRDGTPMTGVNGSFLLYKTVNGQRLASRITMTSGQSLGNPIDTTTARLIEIGDQLSPDGDNIRAKAVRTLRITIADTAI